MEESDIVSNRFLGVSVSVMRDGKYIDDEGDEHDVPAGVKISMGNAGVKLSAIQFAGVLQAMKEPDFRSMLKEIYTVEKTRVSMTEPEW